MSASREKKLRQDQSASGVTDVKTRRELEQKKAEQRTNRLYAVIGVVFVLAVVVCLIWKSNIINRSATAVTIDGEKYTAAEVSYYYNSVYNSFLQNYSYFTSYLGLDTSVSLKSQTLNATAASMLGAEEGSSWYDYMMDTAIQQMTLIQNTLKQAKAEGFQFSEGVQAQHDDSMAYLADTAAGSGLSVKKYLQQSYGSTMTKKVYSSELLRTLQYYDYYNAYTDSLTYTQDEIKAAYDADPRSYDRVNWEYVIVSGEAETTTDAEGNTVQPTEEETAAAKKAAKETADAILAAYKSGKSLESAAADYETATYYDAREATYYDSTTGNWLFDDARVSDEADVLEVSSSYYVAVFHERYLEESDTVDVRHILVMTESGEKASGDEGYEEEQAQLAADAHAEAEEILAQWKSGEATEDSFIRLAMERSDDSSKYTGGLIADVSVDSSLVESFKEWCLDPARKAGDTDVVDSTYGSHVMYFSKTDLPVWQSSVAADLRSEALSVWMEEMTADAAVTRSNFGMKLVG